MAIITITESAIANIHGGITPWLRHRRNNIEDIEHRLGDGFKNGLGHIIRGLNNAIDVLDDFKYTTVSTCQTITVSES